MRLALEYLSHLRQKVVLHLVDLLWSILAVKMYFFEGSQTAYCCLQMVPKSFQYGDDAHRNIYCSVLFDGCKYW